MVRDEYLVLLPPTAQVRQEQLTWDAITQYAFVTCSTNTCHAAVYQHLAQHQVGLATIYDVQESSTAVSLVAQGLGATILAQLAASPIPPNVQVYSLPVPLERVIGVAVPAKALRTPAMFAFLDRLLCSNDGCHLKTTEESSTE